MVVGTFLVNWLNVKTHFSDVQTPGHVFVMGTGESGQFGLGDRPQFAYTARPSSVLDKEVRDTPGTKKVGRTTQGARV